MVPQLPADTADPAGGVAAPDHQEPEGDEQVTTVDSDEVVEERWQEEQEEAERVLQLGLMGLGITNCHWAYACGHGQQTTARAWACGGQRAVVAATASVAVLPWQLQVHLRWQGD